MDNAIFALLATFRVVIASTASALEEVLPTATVEAEYGDLCVEGTQVTLAHHGPRADNPCPCLASVEPLPEGSTVGVSHLDLDTLGGILRLAGYVPASPEEELFWAAAAQVDVRGPHHLGAILGELAGQELPGWSLGVNDVEYLLGASRGEADVVTRRLQAYWAWSQEHRCFPPRDGSAKVVSHDVQCAAKALLLILQGDEDLLAKGDEWAAKEEELNEASYQGTHGSLSLPVIRRKASAFTNHLYTLPKQGGPGVGAVVVALRDDFHSVTVSRADDSVPLNCRDLVQSLWGEEAGGHAGIAGSPRGREMTEDDLNTAIDAVCEALRVAS